LPKNKSQHSLSNGVVVSHQRTEDQSIPSLASPSRYTHCQTILDPQHFSASTQSTILYKTMHRFMLTQRVLKQATLIRHTMKWLDMLPQLVRLFLKIATPILHNSTINGKCSSMSSSSASTISDIIAGKKVADNF
jgi:hypothetical protein